MREDGRKRPRKTTKCRPLHAESVTTNAQLRQRLPFARSHMHRNSGRAKAGLPQGRAGRRWRATNQRESRWEMGVDPPRNAAKCSSQDGESNGGGDARAQRNARALEQGQGGQRHVPPLCTLRTWSYNVSNGHVDGESRETHGRESTDNVRPVNLSNPTSPSPLSPGHILVLMVYPMYNERITMDYNSLMICTARGS